jgi:hypothetical protein
MCPTPKSSQAGALADHISAGDDPSCALDEALDMLSAVDSAGYVLTLREPSADMLSAGAVAGDISARAAYRIWRAMIGASE